MKDLILFTVALVLSSSLILAYRKARYQYAAFAKIRVSNVRVIDVARFVFNV